MSATLSARAHETILDLSALSAARSKGVCLEVTQSPLLGAPSPFGRSAAGASEKTTGHAIRMHQGKPTTPLAR